LKLFYYIHIFIINSPLKECIPPSEPKVKGTFTAVVFFVP